MSVHEFRTLLAEFPEIAEQLRASAADRAAAIRDDRPTSLGGADPGGRGAVQVDDELDTHRVPGIEDRAARSARRAPPRAAPSQMIAP